MVKTNRSLPNHSKIIKTLIKSMDMKKLLNNAKILWISSHLIRYRKSKK